MKIFLATKNPGKISEFKEILSGLSVDLITCNDLEIPEDIFIENLVLDTGVKMGDLMVGSMDKELSKEWFGVAPPDLTLVARKRTPEWVYTYLRAFYEDSSKADS